MTDENPYASPIRFDEVDETITIAPQPQSVSFRPRWWEVLVFVVLAIGAMTIAGSLFLMSGPRGFDSVRLIQGTLMGLVSFVTVVGFTGGMIVARVWRQGGLPTGPSPGHALLLAMLVGTTLYIPFVTLTNVVGMSTPLISTSLILICLGVIALIQNGVVFALIPRESPWSFPANLFLALAFFGFALDFFKAFTISMDEGPSMIPDWDRGLLALMHMGWILSAGFMLSTAFREHDSIRTTRDWLHWTGVACWAIVTIAHHGMPFV